MKEKEEQTKVKYIRQNGKDVEGEVAIEAVRKQQLKDCVRNTRLGNYNRFGRYIMSPGIINDLLRVTKYIHKDHFKDAIEDSKGGIELKASSYLPVFGELEFRLVIKDKFAKLYIMESVYRELNGYQEIYGEEVVESFCDDDKADIIEYNLALFNMKVVDKNDIDGKKLEDLQEDSEIVENILAQKVFLSIVAKNYLKGSITDEKETFEEIVEKLKTEGGEYGKRVLKHFIDRIEKRPDIMQIPEDGGYNEALNDMLVGAMEVATTEDDMLDPNIAKLYDDIYDIRYRKTDRQMDDATQGVTPESLQNVLGRLGVELTGDPQKEDGSTPREALSDIINRQNNAAADTREPLVTIQGGQVSLEGFVDALKATAEAAMIIDAMGKLKGFDPTKQADAVAGNIDQQGKEFASLLGETQQLIEENMAGKGEKTKNGPEKSFDKIVKVKGDNPEDKVKSGGGATQKGKGGATGGSGGGATGKGGKGTEVKGSGYIEVEVPPLEKTTQNDDVNLENLTEEQQYYYDELMLSGHSHEEALAKSAMFGEKMKGNTSQTQGGSNLDGRAQTIDEAVQTGGSSYETGGVRSTENAHSHNITEDRVQ